jgi:long-chain acyl-CoA synthetase
MHLTEIADRLPDRPAVVVDGGASLTFRELDGASRRLAALFAQRGLRAGDRIAVLLPNTAAYFPIAWAAQRSGLLYVPVNWHLSGAEAVHIVADSGAGALVASGDLGELAAAVAAEVPGLDLLLGVGPAIPEFEDVRAVLGGTDVPPPRSGETEGTYMFYSSGTTGRPKGILPELTGAPFGTGVGIDHRLEPLYGFGADTVYLCPGPLYHAAPLGWSLGTQRLGGTVVVMARFEPERFLALVERHRVTHVQCVPTMFVRLLGLPAEVRARYDVSSLRAVVHAAAPCPADVKRAVIDWLGPIVHEYYAGSEGNCFVHIDSVEWLSHPGSVGRPEPGIVHVLGEDGEPLPSGEIGTLWFSGGRRFRYHRDPERTAAAFDDQGRSTLGDVGRLDAEGYLYLADRRTDLIIAGGVNIYPREVEEVISRHPDVADVAVVAVPDPDRGHAVRAVVQPRPDVPAGPELAAELVAFACANLAAFKCPRAVDFDDELPRLPTGKLLRREVRARYWPAAEPPTPG